MCEFDTVRKPRGLGCLTRLLQQIIGWQVTRPHATCTSTQSNELLLEQLLVLLPPGFPEPRVEVQVRGPVP
jgi:hypothetical protein